MILCNLLFKYACGRECCTSLSLPAGCAIYHILSESAIYSCCYLTVIWSFHIRVSREGMFCPYLCSVVLFWPCLNKIYSVLISADVVDFFCPLMLLLLSYACSFHDTIVLVFVVVGV
jgi:hypothetical protein